MRFFQSHTPQPARLHRVEPTNRKDILLKVRAILIIAILLLSFILFMKFCYAVPVGTDSNIYYYHLGGM